MTRIISTLLFFFGVAAFAAAQSPHGETFKMNCAACHNSDSWEIDPDSWDFETLSTPRFSSITGWEIPSDSTKFNHQTTDFPLENSHLAVDCRACHANLVFSDADNTCISCHADVHAQSVGSDCARCHNTISWLVDGIPELHEENGFPLVGGHGNSMCIDCHASETNLRFDRMGNDCISCHQEDYATTDSPDHNALGFSRNCIECHDPLRDDWETEIVEHDFFPLTLGHDIQDCAQCHLTNNFSDASAECVSCHQENFEGTTQPNHETAGFSTDCVTCHTTNPGWEPAEFVEHDQAFFPIYSGAHLGTWSDCIDCHTDPNDFASFTCIACHLNPETDEQHEGVSGYVYEDNACLACHPTGDAMDGFDHDQTNFPLTGAHIGVGCLDCHTDGYAGTPTECSACHAMDFAETVNPDHELLNLSTDCATCHTTDPGWEPASFPVHDEFHPLLGAHALIANDCAACHNGDYTSTPNTCVACHQADFNAAQDPDHVAANFSTDCTECHGENAWVPSSFDNDAFYPLLGAHAEIAEDCNACHNGNFDNTPNTCIGCHQSDFENTTAPNHSAAQFSTDCATCHSEEAWEPATFDHDGQYFPIYSGTHQGEWMLCADCHTNPNNFAHFTCVSCHINPETDDEHTGVNGYAYEDNACLACHPTGDADDSFDHNTTNFPLTGAHVGADCMACHNSGFAGTPTDCAACHHADFAGATNPNHQALGLSTECASCHTTDPGWEPASFPVHDEFHPLLGAHAIIANDCASCHNGDFNTTPTTCVGCHQADFEAVQEPNHTAANFSTDCTQCHGEDAWVPASFDHNEFYPLLGAHAAIAEDCNACHQGDYENTPTTCLGCHQADFDNTTNPNHAAAQFSTDCVLCHTEFAWEPATFDHDGQYFPIYSGAHQGEWMLCTDCHTDPNNFAVFTCIACHINPQTDNEHQGINGYVYQDNACLACHPTGDADDGFDHNSTNFPLTGAHIGVDCLGCHANGFAGTPTDCNACHASDFATATNPNHTELNLSTECATCHTTDPDWMPASFPVHDEFHPLLGAHAGIANDCASCHNGDFDNTPSTCVGCHQADFEATQNPDHTAAQFSTDCTECHTESTWSPSSFDHNQFYVLEGAHALIAEDCNACHSAGYTNTPTTCFGCHQADYNTAINPNHSAAHFPMGCTECHDQTAWSPSSFDHDGMYFPIYSGNHQNEWTLCTECHTVGNDFSIFSCIDCHEHNNQPDVDDDHDGVSGYVYESNACYACHPNGD